MANITPVISRVRGLRGLEGYQVAWSPLTFSGSDVGLPVGSMVETPGSGAPTLLAGGGLAGFADKSIQLTGTFGAAGAVLIEGSNDGTNYSLLTNAQGAALPTTSAGLAAITEAVIFVRPRITAGDGTTSLTVTMFFRQTQGN